MYDIKLLPARLKQARNYRGLSKEECAKLFAIHPNSYLRWENGSAVLNARQLAELAEHEQIDLNFFF
ncbi:MAG: helix-turn-helix transcriptional regulator [Spirochaetales bacterium]|nr:helix-turn-helix transcriptional regulator [Spirochaetales bacterium]